MAHPGDVMARDFLKLEARRQQLEIAQWQSLEGIRCRHAVEEAQKVAAVEQLDRRLEHGERERERTMERNQIIREQASLYQRQAGSQVAILPPGGKANMFLGSTGGTIMGRSEAVERLRDSREMFAGQVERMAGQWHQVIEDQMREEIKMTRADSTTCKVRQNEMLQAACRQEQLLQELVLERRQMQEERSKMYSLDKELAERNKALREKLDLEREAIDTSLLKGTHPADLHTRSIAPREATAAGKVQLTMGLESSANTEHINVSLRNAPNSNANGPGGSLMTSLATVESSKGYVPAMGSRQFEVYQRLKQYENEMNTDLRLLEAAPLPVLLRETPVPKSDGTMRKQKFEPGTGPPLIVVPPPLETIHLPTKVNQNSSHGDGCSGTDDIALDESLVSRMHGAVEQSQVASFHSNGTAPEINASFLRQTSMASAASEQRPSVAIEKSCKAESEPRPTAAIMASPSPLADLMAYTQALPRRPGVGTVMSSEVQSEPASSDVLAQPISAAASFFHESRLGATTSVGIDLGAAERLDVHADARNSTDRFNVSGSVGTPGGASMAGFGLEEQGYSRPIPPPLMLDTQSVTTQASPRPFAGFSTVSASSSVAAVPQTSIEGHSSTALAAIDGHNLQLPTGHTIELLTSGTPLSAASNQVVLQDPAAMQNVPTKLLGVGSAPVHSLLPAMTPFSPASQSGEQNLLAYSGDLVSSGEPNIDAWIPDALPERPQQLKATDVADADVVNAMEIRPSSPTEKHIEKLNTAVSSQVGVFEAQESAEHTTPSFLRLGSGSESVLGDVRRAPHPSDTLSLSASATDAGSFLHSVMEGADQSAVHARLFGSQGLQLQSPSGAALTSQAETTSNASFHAGLQLPSPSGAALAPPAEMASNASLHAGTPMSGSHIGLHHDGQSQDSNKPDADDLLRTESSMHQADSSRVAGWWRDQDTRPVSWGRGSGAGTPNSLASAGVNAGGNAAIATPQSPHEQPEALGAGMLENVGASSMAVNSEARPFSRMASPANSNGSNARRQDEALAAIAAGLDPLAKRSNSSDAFPAGRSGYPPRQSIKAPWETGGGLQGGAGAAELDDEEVQGSESEGRLEDALLPPRIRAGMTPGQQGTAPGQQGTAPGQQGTAPAGSTVNLLAPDTQASGSGRGGGPPALNSFDFSPGVDELSESEDVLKASLNSEEGSGSFQQKRRGNPLARGQGRGSSLRLFGNTASTDSLGSLGSLGGATTAARGKAKAKAKGAMSATSSVFAGDEFNERSSPSKTSSWMRPKAKAKSRFGSSSLAAALGGEIDWSQKDDPRW